MSIVTPRNAGELYAAIDAAAPKTWNIHVDSSIAAVRLFARPRHRAGVTITINVYIWPDHDVMWSCDGSIESCWTQVRDYLALTDRGIETANTEGAASL